MKPIRTARASVLALSAALLFPIAAQAQTATPAAAAPVAPATGEPGWAIASSEIPADPSIRFGTLPNGMRYAIQRHETPTGDAAVRLGVRVGIKDETDAQAGAAHFIEHMAFNGSKNIPEGKLVPMLERLGLSFGADTNASTGFDLTTYKLDLPNTKAETVEAALGMMREVAGRLTLAPAAVERERGILLSEASVRNDANRRRGASLLSAGLPGNRIGPRLTALPERIRGITAAQLRTFYDAYYRPDRATLVITGNVDPAAIEARIKALFADWQPAGPAGTPYAGPGTDGAGPRFAAFTDPAIPEIVAFSRVRPQVPVRNTMAEQRDDLLESLAWGLVGLRFQPIALKADSPVLGAQFERAEIADNGVAGTLHVVARDGQWEKALATGEQELRRAAQYGFTGSEVDEMKREMLAMLTNAAAQQASRKNPDLAEALIRDSLAGRVTTSPAFDLASWQAMQDTITPASLTGAFRKVWGTGPSLIHVSAKTPIADPATRLAALYGDSGKVAVAAPVDKALTAFAYDSFGPAGKVVADTTVADLGIRTVRFANGLQLNLKRTDWAPGKVSFTMNVGAGARAFPRDKPGLSAMADMLLPGDGLKAHDATELRRILSGRDVTLKLSTGSEAVSSSGQVPAADLALQLKLLAARLTATAFRPETGAQWPAVAGTVGQAMAGQPLAVWQVEANNILTGGDGRVGLPSPDAFAARSFAELQAALAPQLAQGPVALALVGDFDPDAAIAAVANTLGALPARAARSATIPGVAPLAFRAKGVTEVTHNGQADQGVVSVSWPTTDDSDLRSTLTRDLLAAAMHLRALDVVREKLGATYSPNGSSFAQSAFPGYGHITLVTTATPKDMALVSGAFRQIAAEMRDRPLGEDLLRRAREPILTAQARADRDNQGWTATVVNAQSDPARLHRRRQRTALLQSITAADIQAAARRYLVDGKAAEIRVVPRVKG